MDAIRSFSGSHPFRPACLKARLELDDPEAPPEVVLDALEDLIWFIDHGFCPRCREPLERKYPAGSRITGCRCVPICHLCGEHEALRAVCSPWTWHEDPLDPDDVRAEVERVRAMGKQVEGILSGDTLITDEGASKLVPRPGVGGWFELGDDGDDEDERRGR